MLDCLLSSPGMTKAAWMTKSLAPETFQQTMSVPQAGYRTAIAVTHGGRMSEVSVTFTLRSQDGTSAAYAAPCPRCEAGEISVTVKINADGSFAEVPACPALCMDCEDRLDALLEPEAGKSLADESNGRAMLSKYLKAMNVRSWD
jgi:hypothetical protein